MDIEDLTKKINSIDYLSERKFQLEEETVYDYIKKILEKIDDNTNKTYYKKIINNLEKEFKLTKKIKQSEINYFSRKMFQENKISFKELLKLKNHNITKKVRSQSGIIEIAIMTSPGNFSCDYNCYYCPDQPDMPRSYIKEEPAVKRAAQNDFDPVKQFHDRATTYSLNGHPVDKIEVIVLGGTWSSYPLDYRNEFIRDVFYAANTFYENDKSRKRLSLEEEQKINENCLCHIVGLTLETRPDQIDIHEIKRYNNYGVTRVQLGIQHTDNYILKKINRQSTVEDAMRSIRLLKDCGFKIMIHIMPNLPFSSVKKDRAMFNQILYDEALQADEWKIYPTSVTTTSCKDDEPVNTVIEKWFREGKYEPYDNEDLFRLLIDVKSRVHPYIRIARIFRDIPLPNITGGADVPNMRQVIQDRMKKMNKSCACIRCHEIKNRKIEYHLKTDMYWYNSSSGKECFISVYEDNPDKKYILGFGRLRFANDPGLYRETEHYINGIKDCALLRELHVYGKVNFVDGEKKSNNQHKGIGKKIINCAESLAGGKGYKLAIISGVGVRNYYRKLGYELIDGYMVKDTSKKYFYRDLLTIFVFLTITVLLKYYLKI